MPPLCSSVPPVPGMKYIHTCLISGIRRWRAWQITLSVFRRAECCALFNRNETTGDTYPPSILTVRLGAILASDSDPDAVFASVSKVIHYRYYEPLRLHRGDFGLLKLTRPVTFTDTILPICLPNAPDVNVNHFKVCVSTGFGSIKFDGG